MTITNRSTLVLAGVLAGLVVGCPENDNLVGEETPDGSTGDGATQDGSSEDGATGDGATDDGSTGDGSSEDGATGDGSSEDGATGDGATGDGSTGDDLASCQLPTDTAQADLDKLREMRAQLADSRALWDARSLEDRDYRYTRSIGSFTGWTCSTVVEVRDGVIVSRTVTTRQDAQAEPVTFTEEGADINSNQVCFEAELLETLYDQCKSDTLCQVPSQVWFTYAFDDTTKLLSSCTYFPMDCADDCVTGPALSLELL